MFTLGTSSWLGRTLFEVLVFGLFGAQSPSPAQPPAQSPVAPSAQNSASFDRFVDSAIRQERRLADLMRNFKPVIETYIQEEKPDSQSLRRDDYFLI